MKKAGNLVSANLAVVGGLDVGAGANGDDLGVPLTMVLYRMYVSLEAGQPG
jgi:hypothetical protein